MLCTFLPVRYRYLQGVRGNADRWFLNSDCYALLPAGVGKTLYHPETLVAHSTGNRNEQTSYCKPTTSKEKEIPLTHIV
ncbi:hypothetical protein XENORESO_010368 [Xenotaenia resolanae]|uniref:Uncharacterized protein n=1 Tax=Xenotaenia resolanae TaxID=208358 RepID=A0ABV0W9I8_9TELE